MTLWFENQIGQEREIAQVNTWEDVYKAIDDFIEQCNKKKMESKEKPRLFKRYYSRIWQRGDSRYCIDVGSHTEFFITDLPYTCL